MNRAERAKQFMPFDALKGLREELLIRERMALRASRRELFEEEAEQLSHAILSLAPGARVELLIYDDGYYRSLVGEVLSVDTVFSRLVLLCDGVKRIVVFHDIYRLCEA